MYKLIIPILMILLPSSKRLEAEGFVLEWTHYEDYLRISISAPSTGWVAVGFTEGTGIVNTNLIQGRSKEGEVHMEDQYVVALGKHPKVEELSVDPRIFDFEGVEKDGNTTLSFSIYKAKVDDLHYDLSEGNEINVWLAYSVSDDFDHHSRKRILRTIIL